MVIIRYVVIIIIVVTSVVGGTFVITKNFFCTCPAEKKDNVLKMEYISSNVESGSGCEIVVDVSGSVKNPGVICLPSGSVVNDAILKAGNFNTDFLAFRYVSQRINLAEKLENNQKIYIPFENETLCSMKEYGKILHSMQ
jgi:competence protein ComEA